MPTTPTMKAFLFANRNHEAANKCQGQVINSSSHERVRGRPGFLYVMLCIETFGSDTDAAKLRVTFGFTGTRAV